MRITISILLAGIALAGCRATRSHEVTREEAIEIARGPADSIPGNDLAATHPVVRDGGPIWIVRFERSDGASGGSVQVDVDKQTGRVISAMAEQ